MDVLKAFSTKRLTIPDLVRASRYGGSLPVLATCQYKESDRLSGQDQTADGPPNGPRQCSEKEISQQRSPASVPSKEFLHARFWFWDVIASVVYLVLRESFCRSNTLKWHNLGQEYLSKFCCWAHYSFYLDQGHGGLYLLLYKKRSLVKQYSEIFRSSKIRQFTTVRVISSRWTRTRCCKLSFRNFRRKKSFWWDSKRQSILCSTMTTR